MRYLAQSVVSDLKKKMVFISGPRQVGKTTLSKNLFEAEKKSLYLNYDADDDRNRILRHEFPNDLRFLVLDEIHKFKHWRRLTKGLFDTRKSDLKILVTGSGRLDVYGHGGDSLQGRYYHHRMHPLCALELNLTTSEALDDLLNLSGFPEPYFSQSQVERNRWAKGYMTRLVREDVRDLEHVIDLGQLELLQLRLPELVGSPLSINGLREDIDVSHAKMRQFLQIFERLFVIFRLSPFGVPKLRAVKKEQKHYHYDWALITKEGPRFENMMASFLQKWVHFIEDTQGRNVELKYFRDVDKREVDFVIVEDQKPILFVETKLSADEISPSLHYIRSKFSNSRAAFWQVHLHGNKSYVSNEGIRVANFIEFSKDLSGILRFKYKKF